MIAKTLIAAALTFFAWATLIDVASGSHQERYYDRPDPREMGVEERERYEAERRFLRKFGIRYQPRDCVFELLDESEPYVESNLLFFCLPLRIRHTEQ